MKTYDIRDDAGRLLGFEISNTWLSRRQAAFIVASVPGVTITRPVRRPFSMEPAIDEFCAFHVEDVECFLWEPFGDNSRYYIGSRAERASDQLAMIREAFSRVSPVLTISGLLRIAYLVLLFRIAFVKLSVG